MSSRLKKYWLLSSALYFITLLGDAFRGDPYFNFEFTLSSFVLLIPFGYLFIESLNFTALFFFSYKKNGTVLLTLNMVLSLFRVYVVMHLLWQWRIILDAYANQTRTKLIIDSIASAIYLLIILQWIVLSFKLRRANKLEIKKEILSRPEHQRAIQGLQAIDNLGELSLRYGTDIQNYPQIASELKEIYEQRRSDLGKA